MVQLQNSILKHMHDHTLSSMLFDGIFEAHRAQNFIMFWPRGERLAYSLTNLPNLLIIFPNFFHSTLYLTWTTPSLNCKCPSMLCTHPIDPMWIPFTLPSWQ